MEQHNVDELCDVDTLEVIVLYSSETPDKCEDKLTSKINRERERQISVEKSFDWKLNEDY